MSIAEARKSNVYEILCKNSLLSKLGSEQLVHLELLFHKVSMIKFGVIQEIGQKMKGVYLIGKGEVYVYGT